VAVKAFYVWEGESSPVIHPPVGSTASGRKMSTWPVLLRCMVSFTCTRGDETKKLLRDMCQLVYEKVNTAASRRLAMKSFHGHLHLVPVHAASVVT